ncbi:hypothetical protein QBC40DRAFT_299183 [Triangularia verruculosa]|uniref:Uncharacterized protein n=1 Tax=Triangularia verruculosa TaxID=2587418 RepID=A0AAN7ASN3_9PEZI|nr:hypothetical protein QBC40DRAFT_299183 [Triangularia verruculosa]
MLSVNACQHIRHMTDHGRPWHRHVGSRRSHFSLRDSFPNLESYEVWMIIDDVYFDYRLTGTELFLLHWSVELWTLRIAELPDILDPAAIALWNVFFWYLHLEPEAGCKLRQLFDQPSLRSTTLISGDSSIEACIVLKKLDKWLPYRPITLLEVSIHLNCPLWPEDAEALRAWGPTFTDFDLYNPGPIPNESRERFQKALSNVQRAIGEGVFDNKFPRCTKAFFELEKFVNWRDRPAFSRSPRGLTSSFLRQLGLVEDPEIIRAAESCATS